MTMDKKYGLQRRIPQVGETWFKIYHNIYPTTPHWIVNNPGMETVRITGLDVSKGLVWFVDNNLEIPSGSKLSALDIKQAEIHDFQEFMELLHG